MRAYVIEEYGPEARFQFMQMPQPVPQANQVLVKVDATSVNPIDTKIRQGLVGPVSPDLPAVLHGDVCGTVEAVGDDVTGFEPGDQVYGFVGGVKGWPGALAEYLAVDHQLLAKKPGRLSLKEAAVLPLVSITAWLGLYDRARLKRGQQVLVQGGTGGVGHVALQLAKWHGCHVTTTVSTPVKAELARRLGADEVVVYPQEPVDDYVGRITQGKGFDVVMDTVGGGCLDNSFQAVAAAGQVIAIAARSQHDLTPLHGKSATLQVVFMILPLLQNQGLSHFGGILNQLATWVDEGKLTPLLDDRIFAMDEVNEAHEYLMSGQAVGKVAVCW